MSGWAYRRPAVVAVAAVVYLLLLTGFPTGAAPSAGGLSQSVGATSPSAGQDMLTGQVIYNLPCLAHPEQGYALYLPSQYSPDRSWPLLMGFHFEGKGIAIVQTYQAAAEQYGYIVAASNDSRNGSSAASAKVAQAMAADVSARFSVDVSRVYTTGLSGGSRLAINIAMANKAIAGVIASSAGFTDTQPRASLRFPLFATVGSVDFNYIEMRALDRALKTPHRLAVFEGGHVLPPSSVATEAIEFMELQAMASGLRPRDESLIDRLWEKRQRAIETAGESPAAVRLLQAVAEDFGHLRDVQATEARSLALARRPDVKAAIERERRNDLAETDLVNEFVVLEVDLSDESKRDASLTALRSLVADLRRRAGAIIESPDRARARRVLEIVTYAPFERVHDRDYLTLLLQPNPRK